MVILIINCHTNYNIGANEISNAYLASFREDLNLQLINSSIDINTLLMLVILIIICHTNYNIGPKKIPNAYLASLRRRSKYSINTILVLVILIIICHTNYITS